MLYLSPVLAQALQEYPDLGSSLTFLLLGFAMVVLVLGVLWGACELLGLVFRNRKKHAPKRAATPAPPPKPAESTTEGYVDASEEQRIVAVVSAAVYATLGAHHRIISIRPSGDRQAWSAEGRRSIFQSHKIR